MQNNINIDITSVYYKLYKLNPALTIEANDYIDFLLKKKSGKNAIKKQLKAGFAKGFFKMKDDFDEPLEDFKEYML